MTLQERLRERAGEDGNHDFYMEAADALDAQAERIKALEGELREIDAGTWTGETIDRIRALLGDK